jgi:hypothetical protein
MNPPGYSKKYLERRQERMPKVISLVGEQSELLRGEEKLTKSSQRQGARGVAQGPPGPARGSTIEIELLLFDSERQLCPRHDRKSNRHSCGAHSSSHHRNHDAAVNVGVMSRS